METAFWHERWENNQIGFHQEEFHSSLEKFWPRLHLPQGSRIFVPLCGKSNDMLWLLEQGYRVLGVELSPIAVEAFFRENQIPFEKRERGELVSCSCDEVEILCGDFFALRREDLAEVGGFYDRASLVALPPPMRERYARHLADLLGEGAKGLLVSFAYPQHEMEGPPFSVPEEEVRSLFDGSFGIEKMDERDVLQENPGFAVRGVTSMAEALYAFERTPGSSRNGV